MFRSVKEHLILTFNNEYQESWRNRFETCMIGWLGLQFRIFFQTKDYGMNGPPGQGPGWWIVTHIHSSQRWNKFERKTRETSTWLNCSGQCWRPWTANSIFCNQHHARPHVAAKWSIRQCGHSAPAKAAETRGQAKPIWPASHLRAGSSAASPCADRDNVQEKLVSWSKHQEHPHNAKPSEARLQTPQGRNRIDHHD